MEAQSEHIQYLWCSENVQNDHVNQINNDNDIDEKIPEIINDSDDVDDITPLHQIPVQSTAYQSTATTNLSCIEDTYTDKGRHLPYHMTARRAMKETPDKEKPAIVDDLTNLTKGVLTGRHWGDLTPTQRPWVLRSHNNVTDKVTPASDGTSRTEDKIKARHIANGDG